MYPYCKIKNISGEEKTFVNKILAIDEEYEIPDARRELWSSDENVILAITQNELQVANAEEYLIDFSTQIDCLKSLVITPSDTDDVPLVRIKQATLGWVYTVQGLEFETSVLSSDYNKKYDGSNYDDTNIYLYNSADELITEQSVADTDCVKTVFEYEPKFDIELIGGAVSTTSIPTNDLRVWFIAVPDIPAAFGGTKIMIDGINLKYNSNKEMNFDGRVAKTLTYDATNHTNKFHIISKHEAGYKLKVFIMLEYYRA